MVAPIGMYNYPYGGGNQLNRQIQFFRPGGANTIRAEVHVLAGGVAGALISKVSGNQISVEMQSTSQKANAMMFERNGGPPFVRVPNRQLSHLPVL